jgi:hypothetical protein
MSELLFFLWLECPLQNQSRDLITIVITLKTGPFEKLLGHESRVLMKVVILSQEWASNKRNILGPSSPCIACSLVLCLPSWVTRLESPPQMPAYRTVSHNSFYY